MLTGKQREVAEAIASGMAKTQIADKYEVSRTAIYEWQKNPEFKNYIDNFIDDTVEEGKKRLKSLTQKAINELERLLSSNSANVREKAARAILDRSGFAPEVSTKMELSEPDKVQNPISQDDIQKRLQLLKSKTGTE